MPNCHCIDSAIIPAHFPPAAGTYILILRSDIQASVRIGRLGWLTVEPGYYLYVGSALGPGGLRARLDRHLRGTSQPHWHLDYLRRYVQPVAVWLQAAETRLEHRWASGLMQEQHLSVALARFGASDCRCPSHLFYTTRRPALPVLQDCLGTAADIKVYAVA